MGKGNSAKGDTGDASDSPDQVLAKAKAEAAKIVAAAEAAATSIRDAAKAEKDAAKPAAQVAAASAPVPRTVISVKVMAVRKGYANHRVYKPGDKFVYRYHSHDSLGGLRTREQMLGSWMVDESDQRYGVKPDQLNRVGEIMKEAETNDDGSPKSTDSDVL